MSVPIRLSDVPLNVRVFAARQECNRTPDEQERHPIVAAALHPSERVYWLTEAARPQVEAWKQTDSNGSAPLAAAA